MQANEFVKKFGWEEAEEIVGGLPEKFKFKPLGSVCWDNNTYKYSDRFKPRSSLVNMADLKRLVDSLDLIEKLGGLERVKNAINGKHIGYTHFYLHSNNSYVFLDHYVDFIPDHAQHIGMFNKVIADVESCQ